MRGVAIVQVCNMSGGATISPKRDRAAASGSVYTGFSSSNAAAQCLIIGRFTGSGPRVVPPSLIGRPTNADAVYIDVNEAKLPSGLGVLDYGMKVMRHPVRANNQWYEPKHRWPGGEMTDESIARWVNTLPR